MSSNKKCWCFPEKDIICKKYFDKSEDKYLAEKTCSTIKQWLGGRNLREYALIPHYAVYDFQQYICKDDNPACVPVMMNAEIHTNQVTEAIDKIATPCPCAPPSIPRS